MIGPPRMRTGSRSSGEDSTMSLQVARLQPAVARGRVLGSDATLRMLESTQGLDGPAILLLAVPLLLACCKLCASKR